MNNILEIFNFYKQSDPEIARKIESIYFDKKKIINPFLKTNERYKVLKLLKDIVYINECMANNQNIKIDKIKSINLINDIDNHQINVWNASDKKNNEHIINYLSPILIKYEKNMTALFIIETFKKEKLKSMIQFLFPFLLTVFTALNSFFIFFPTNETKKTMQQIPILYTNDNKINSKSISLKLGEQEIIDAKEKYILNRNNFSKILVTQGFTIVELSKIITDYNGNSTAICLLDYIYILTLEINNFQLSSISKYYPDPDKIFKLSILFNNNTHSYFFNLVNNTLLLFRFENNSIILTGNDAMFQIMGKISDYAYLFPL